MALLKNSNQPWISASMLFDHFGGTGVLLQQFKKSKLPVKLPTFHQQVLQYWKMIYTEVQSSQYATVKQSSCFVEKEIYFYRTLM